MYPSFIHQFISHLLCQELPGTEDVKRRGAVHDFNESSGKDKLKTDLM